MAVAWHVWQNEDQRFVVKDLKTLKEMAKQGKIFAQDLVQPEGAIDWLYAFEVPGMNDTPHYDIDTSHLNSKKPSLIAGVIGFGAIFGALFCSYQAFEEWKQIPSESELQILGESGLSPDEALTTSTAKVLDDPTGSTSGTLDKDTKVKLIEKRKDMFKVETSRGEGWISIYDLAPAYLMAEMETRNLYDSRFNTYRKIEVRNPSWERAEYGSDITNLRLSLQNLSTLAVNEIVILVTLSDTQGHSLKKEVFVQGTIKESDTDIIGTLKAEDEDGKDQILTRSELRKLKKKNPDVIDRWSEVIEIPLGNQEFIQPSIEIKIDDARPILEEKD